MAIKVYGMAMSTCVRRVTQTLNELGLDYELVEVNLMKGENKAPEYLAKQPFGKIPVLEDGDLAIFESRAICRYLARKYADKGVDLIGKTIEEQALVENWIEVESQNYGPVSDIVSQKMFKPMFGGVTDEEAVAKAITQVNAIYDIYDKVLATRPYLGGQNFSLADIVHLPYTQYMMDSGVTGPMDSHPNVKAWWQRCTSRPAYLKTIGKA